MFEIIITITTITLNKRRKADFVADVLETHKNEEFSNKKLKRKENFNTVRVNERCLYDYADNHYPESNELCRRNEIIRYDADRV